MSHLHQSSPPVHVDDLPSEILREIFIATYPPELFEPGSHLTRGESISAPRRLSHVSRRWRGETFSYGELWSYLTLTEDDIARNRQSSLELFLTFLERTKSSPINFRLCINPYSPFEQEPRHENEKMISALLEHQRRWKNVTITWYGKISSDFQRLQISDVPFVKSLSLHINVSRVGVDNAMDHPPHIDVHRSPWIESLELSGDYRLEIGELPTYGLLRKFWHRPSSFEGAAYTQSAKLGLKILDLAPNLHHVYLDFPWEEQMGTYSIGKPRLHRVKELILLHGYSCMEVIENLHVPELEKLEYSGTEICQGRTLLSMVQRSHPPLSCLRIYYIPDNTTMLEILRLLPTLVELKIDMCFRAAALFRGLVARNRTDGGHISPDKDETVLCPRLHSLWLQMTGRFPEELATEHTDVLFSMLDSRMEIMGTCNKVFLVRNSFVPTAVSFWSSEGTEFSLMRRDYDCMKQFFKYGGFMTITSEKD